MKNSKVRISRNKSKRPDLRLYCFLLLLFCVHIAICQVGDTASLRQYENIIRYNLSGALIFGLIEFSRFRAGAYTKITGMSYVFADDEINGNGVMSTTSIEYQYLVHAGFNF